MFAIIYDNNDIDTIKFMYYDILIDGKFDGFYMKDILWRLHVW
jgi:hypothetical protein